MKYKVFLFILLSLLMVGCGKNSEKTITKKIINNFNNSSGYKISGDLEVTNNDEVYNYDVNVGYDKKNKYYKVVLKNQSNDFEQIILRNKEGVFLYTPSLNKSFKFSNDWPYNNSQIYLFDTIINDIKKDEEKKYRYEDNKYIYETKANYSNNIKLKNQKIIFDKDYKLKMVLVYDNNGNPIMKFNISKFSLSPKFGSSYFNLDNKSKNSIIKKQSSVMSIDDIVYPLFLPNGTKLVDEKKINKDNGQRVIMTYDGEKNFVLVEETIDVFNEFTTISSDGVPFQLLDTIGVMTSNSLSWTSGNLEYYLVSDVMNQSELLEVAQSMVRVESFK